LFDVVCIKLPFQKNKNIYVDLWPFAKQQLANTKKMATQWRICPKINCTLGISNCSTENPEFNSGFPVDFSWYFAAIFGYRMENHPEIKRGNGNPLFIDIYS